MFNGEKNIIETWWSTLQQLKLLLTYSIPSGVLAICFVQAEKEWVLETQPEDGFTESFQPEQQREKKQGTQSHTLESPGTPSSAPAYMQPWSQRKEKGQKEGLENLIWETSKIW